MVAFIFSFEQVQDHISQLLLTITEGAQTTLEQLAKVTHDSSSASLVTIVTSIVNTLVQEAQGMDQMFKNVLSSRLEYLKVRTCFSNTPNRHIHLYTTNVLFTTLFGIVHVDG